MPRTPLANQVQEMISVAQEALQREVSTEQVLEERRATKISRREALKLGLAGTSALALSPLAKAANATPAPRIAIVGAGLAGLSAAGAYVRNLEGFAGEQREGQGAAQNLPPALASRTIDPDHGSTSKEAVQAVSLSHLPEGAIT